MKIEAADLHNEGLRMFKQGSPGREPPRRVEIVGGPKPNAIYENTSYKLGC